MSGPIEGFGFLVVVGSSKAIGSGLWGCLVPYFSLSHVVEHCMSYSLRAGRLSALK